jgi:hypothetical protein
MQDIAEGEGAPFLPREGNKKDDPSLVCNSHTRSKWAEYFIIPETYMSVASPSLGGGKNNPDKLQKSHWL